MKRSSPRSWGSGQSLPGPNTMNAAMIIGDRFQGVAGVLLCLLGQMALPLVIVTSLGAVYERFAAIPEVNAALVGAAAGAAGLVLGTAIKMARKIRPNSICPADQRAGLRRCRAAAVAADSGRGSRDPAGSRRGCIGAPRVTGWLLLQIARVFGIISLVSIGGANAVLPEIHRQVVDVQGWMNDATFAGIFAISHAAPGPNIIMVSLIGWQLAGNCPASSLPPSLSWCRPARWHSSSRVGWLAGPTGDGSDGCGMD